ncbi:hypothetical protein K8R04_01605 [Candidatus Uhrbacteria bacterium]|nr:hypothetical protein [Candidatus Uhrbacteria bacterium]
MVTLLFDQKAAYLGELVTRDGALRHFVLTQAGERAVGGHVLQWQTRGVPFYKGIAKHGDDGSNEFVTYREYVSARDVAFLKAVHGWLTTQGLQAYDIDEPILPMWERLLRLPLEPAERFRFLIAMMRTPVSRLTAWQELLETAERTSQVERAKTQETLAKLKTTVSKHLLHAFEHEPKI